jgi:hypothetical protein
MEHETFSKQEALGMMKSGVKITHPNLIQHQWITLSRGRVLASGHHYDFDIFWSLRLGHEWREGYSMFDIVQE